MKHVYKVEEIFQPLPDDPDNVVMNIPEEIAAAAGLEVGDTVAISLTDSGLVISKSEPSQD